MKVLFNEQRNFMKRNVLIFGGLGILVVVLIIVLIVQQNNTSQNQNNTNNSQNVPAPGTNDAVETTDQITIKNSDFSPVKTTIKKGTTVVWRNEDDMGHNVVASDANNTGGLPLSAPLLKKGETFSFTFNQIGNFSYHCAPHPFMKGAIEVIESDTTTGS